MRKIALAILFLTAALRAADPAPDFKSKYRVINVHLHCISPVEAGVRAEIEVDDRVGVSNVVVLDGGAPEGSLPAWIKLKQKFPDRLIVFYKLSFKHIDNPTFFADIVHEIDDAARQGIQGVKVWKDLGMYNRDAAGKLLRADDPRLDPFWNKCAELKLPILWHAADPKEYWFPLTYNSIHYGLRKEKDQFADRTVMPAWEQLLVQRETVMQRHPNLIVIGAHFGSMSFDLERLGRTFDRYPNFYVDTAARLRIIGRLNPPAVRDFFTKYQDRLLFGTDGGILAGGRKPSKTGNIYLYPPDDPNWIMIDPADRAAVRKWQDRSAFNYGQAFQYFETDTPGLEDPAHSGGPWLRFMGVKLPPDVLEKLYHANAERLIPGLAGK
jgi:hypothetical protein